MVILFCRVRKIENKNNSVRYNFYICYRYREKWGLNELVSKDIFILSIRPNKEEININFDDLEKIITDKLSKDGDLEYLEINFKELTEKLINKINTTTFL